MPVPARIYDLSSTANSNSPAGSDSIGTSLDDYLRSMGAIVRGDLATKGADIASATTTDLGAVQGLFHDITGTTTITGFGTVAAGVWKVLKFEGAILLTYNATSLILLGGANRLVGNGDIGVYVSEGSGNWREESFQYAAKPGFLAFKSSNTANVVGAGADYTVICDTEVYDRGGDYANGTGIFTAPRTGLYQFNCMVGVSDLSAAMTEYSVALVTSNRTYSSFFPRAVTTSVTFRQPASFLVDMDAGDTATLHINVVNGAGNTADVQGDGTTVYTSFSGALLP